MNDIQKKADTFGADFQARRKAAGLTTMQVASVMEGSMGGIGIHPTFVAAAENGKYPRMKASTKRRLNEALDRAIANKRGPQRPGDYLGLGQPRDALEEANAQYNISRDPKGMRNAWPIHQPGELIPVKPDDVFRKIEVVDMLLLVLVSIAVGALAVLAYSVMKGV